jgi:hypothetical protein
MGTHPAGTLSQPTSGGKLFSVAANRRTITLSHKPYQVYIY